MANLVAQKRQNTTVINELSIATNDLNTYNSYLPTDATTLKNHIEADTQAVPSLANEASLLVTLFSGKKSYLEVVNTKDVPPFSLADSPTLTDVTYDNGKYQSKNSITLTKSISGTTFDDYATQLQTSISQHTDGVILVDASADQSLIQANSTFSSPSTMLSALFATSNQTTTNQVTMGFENGTISIYLDNVLLSKDAIINAIT